MDDRTEPGNGGQRKPPLCFCWFCFWLVGDSFLSYRQADRRSGQLRGRGQRALGPTGCSFLWGPHSGKQPQQGSRAWELGACSVMATGEKSHTSHVVNAARLAPSWLGQSGGSALGCPAGRCVWWGLLGPGILFLGMGQGSKVSTDRLV